MRWKGAGAVGSRSLRSARRPPTGYCAPCNGTVGRIAWIGSRRCRTDTIAIRRGRISKQRESPLCRFHEEQLARWSKKRHSLRGPERRAVTDLSRELSTVSVEKRGKGLAADSVAFNACLGGGRVRNGAGPSDDDAPAQGVFLRAVVTVGAISTRSRNSLPDLKWGTYFSATCTVSPDFGLRPTRGGR